jgi:hypothetical protein
MKFLKAAYVYIPQQVLSTFILWDGIFVWYRGFLSIWTDPSSRTTLLSVIFIGMSFGLIVARAQTKPQNEKDTQFPPMGP